MRKKTIQAKKHLRAGKEQIGIPYNENRVS